MGQIKVIELDVKEFYFFRKLAISMSLIFMCSLSNGVYTVKASSDVLEELGY